ncbi:MAG: hypothetical protein ACE5Q6_15860 [Dehalococcoidia bacterium]
MVEYDRPTLQDLMEHGDQGLPSGAILPVDERWALVWEEVEENEETARRVRESPEGLIPVCYERGLANLEDDLVEHLKDLARDGLGRG